MATLIELLTADDQVVTATSYSINEIWEKRPYLSGSANYAVSPDSNIYISHKDKSLGEIIENTGIDSPAVEIRPRAVDIKPVTMAHVYHTHVTSAHDYNMLVRSYNLALNGNARVNPEAALNVLKEFALSNYDSVVNKYVAACEKGLCQALSNPSGWVVPSKANQEPKIYDPEIANNFSGTLSDFDSNDPTLKLLEDLVLKAQTEGYSPNVIFVGDAVAKAILQSAWYNTNNRTAPISVAFNTTPRESSNAVRANGALELMGMNVAGCKIIWINSMINGVFVFQPNCAVALNDNLWATIYSGPTYANLGLHNDIIRFAPGTILNEKEIRYFYEYSYLPVINNPTEIFRIHYN